MYTETFAQMKKQLGQLDNWLTMAAGHASAKGFDPDVFVQLRLAPDQFTLARQVQVCCETVKIASAYLAGRQPEPQTNVGQTLEQLQQQVRATVQWLDRFDMNELSGAAAVKVSQPRWKGEWMTGPDYFVQHALPNFFFHLTTAYAILRHNGVAVGKRDFLGPQSKHPPA